MWTKLGQKISRDRGLITACLGISGALACANNSTLAQIIPDATLGTRSSIVTPSLMIHGLPSSQINGGVTNGANLFHSFQEFNINAGGGVYFTNPDGISNILTRVTGKNLSNIQGTLGVLGNANLFLINPNGIIFGHNATLDVNGSFVATTANAIGFGTQGIFSATAPSTPTVLTVNPDAFLFNQIAAQSITNQSVATLQVPHGQSLLLVGGKININGGRLQAPQGRIELGAIAEGTVGLTFSGSQLSLSFPDSVTRDDIYLSNGAVVNASGEGGGNIQIQASSLEVRDGSQIIAQTLGPQSGGSLLVSTSEAVKLIGTTPDDKTVSALLTTTVGAGAAGDIIIVTKKLIASGGSLVSTATFGEGPGGNLTVNAADSVDLTAAKFSQQFFQKFITGKFQLSDLRNGIDSGTFASGAGGNLTIVTGKLTARNGEQIISGTVGSGQAGTLRVFASDSVNLIGTSADARINTDLFSGSLSTGDGNNTLVETQKLMFLNGAEATASTSGFGSGGNVIVNASESVELLGTNGRYQSNLTSTASLLRLPGVIGSGNAGSVTVNTQRLILRHGGQISVATGDRGNGGNLTVNASKSVELTGVSADGQFISGVLADGRGSGNAGNLRINTDNLLIRDGAKVAVSGTGTGNAGNVNIQALSIQLENRGAISASTSSGKGGNLQLQTQQLQLRHDSQISTNAGGSDNGGNITINNDTLVALENSNITANAVIGRGGNIRILTQGIFRSPDSNITATSQLGINGVVEVKTLGFDVQNTLTLFKSKFVSLEQAIAGSCLARRNVQQGRFTVTGTGGLIPTPYDAISGRYNVTRLVPLPERRSSVNNTTVETHWKVGDPIVEAQGIVRTADGRTLLATLPQAALEKASNLVCH